jgi:hypothetical protein
MDRLLRNQKDVGNAIKPYHGKAAGNELTALLTEQIQDAVPVLVAARDGDANALGTAAVVSCPGRAGQAILRISVRTL